MKERLVLVFRSRAVGTGADELALRRKLIEQAIRERGELCAWGGAAFAVDFSAAKLEHAVRFLAEALERGTKRFFAVGVAAGSLDISKMGQGTVAWGPPLSRATALAEIARVGEVLVDSKLDHGRRLLFSGSTRRRFQGKILRGRRLDLRHPFRAVVSAGVHEFVTPLLVGRPELFNLRLLPGTVSVIRIPPGYGGTRFLGELGRSLEPSRVLRLTGASVSDPLGALRRGVVKAVGGKAGFRPAEARSLELLWAGQGPDLDACAALISAWLHGADDESVPTGVVLIDDATHVDRDSLEAVSLAAMHPEVPCAVVIRLGLGDSVPEELAPMQRGSEVVLGELAPQKASALAAGWFAGQLAPGTARRYAGRAGRIPLGIVEALSEALEVGDVVWSEGVADARVRHGGRGRARSPRVYIARRLRWLKDEEHLLLWAVAVFGGEARADDVAALCQRRLGRVLDVEILRDDLLASGWLKPTDERLFALSSTSQGETLLTELRSRDLVAWDRDAAEVLAASRRPLAAGAAAVHAALAGETDKAIRYAKWTADAAEAAGFDETALAFRRFAEEPDAELFEQRRLWTRDVRPTARPSAAADAGDRASFASPSIPVDAPEPQSDDLRRVNAAAVEALSDRDAARLVDVASQAREVGRVELATRLDGLAALVRQEGGEALRILRQQAARRTEKDARTQLAVAVSLAECGQPREAILETLTALATTRRNKDSAGERAAAALLARLSMKFGTKAAARPWVTTLRA